MSFGATHSQDVTDKSQNNCSLYLLCSTHSSSWKVIWWQRDRIGLCVFRFLRLTAQVKQDLKIKGCRDKNSSSCTVNPLQWFRFSVHAHVRIQVSVWAMHQYNPTIYLLELNQHLFKTMSIIIVCVKEVGFTAELLSWIVLNSTHIWNLESCTR